MRPLLSKHTITPPVIGVDFDHTLICYDPLLRKLAVKMGLIPPEHIDAMDKKAIRDAIRLLPDGEHQWQHVQAQLYGEKIKLAQPSKGVRAFLRACRLALIPVYIISHKTEHAAARPDGVSLRVRALTWMKKNRIIGPMGVAIENIYFESTRQAKIERIRYMQCTHFIDDLKEVFLDSQFPGSVCQILYHPHETRTELAHPIQARSFREIMAYFFHETIR